jgi:hypothetical protein
MQVLRIFNVLFRRVEISLFYFPQSAAYFIIPSLLVHVI